MVHSFTLVGSLFYPDYAAPAHTFPNLVTVYKILFDIIDIDFNDYFAFKKKTELPAVILVITIVLLKAMGVSMHDVIILPSGP